MQRTYRFERKGTAASSGDVAAAPWPLVVTAIEFLYFNDSVVLEQNFAGEAGEIRFKRQKMVHPPGHATCNTALLAAGALTALTVVLPENEI